MLLRSLVQSNGVQLNWSCGYTSPRVGCLSKVFLQTPPLNVHTRWQSTLSKSSTKPTAGENVLQFGNSSLSTTTLNDSHHNASSNAARLTLPTVCPGCGALCQEISENDAGFYSRSRRAVKDYLKQQKAWSVEVDHEKSVSPAASTEDEALTKDDIQADEAGTPATITVATTPVCDRCHDLIYNNRAKPISHPTIEAIADSIIESPFPRNHVYHVLDAADFPMSLIPKVFKALQTAKPRSQNRRAQSKFSRKPTLSFIITRSDLLGPSKEVVDQMMPYFQSVLRTALGREGKNIRLGNIHLVSAKRGWWTRDLKNAIWERGGGNWMVGKVNVGKSNLFPVLFPKGSGERAPVYTDLQAKQPQPQPAAQMKPLQESTFHSDSLLPPVQPEIPFPTMPVVSDLPGTTASPIRLSFGKHKGEIVDLPGLERGSLEQYVLPSKKSSLVMQHRPKLDRHVIKPGQSLLLGGGLVRITPKLDPNDPSTTMLAYAFVPLESHLTSTDKAIETQTQQRHGGIRSIVRDDVGNDIALSGLYSLTTDVTKHQAGALLRAGVPLTKLPFRVYATDILIESVGWVELVCQVRRARHKEHDTSYSSDAASQTKQAVLDQSVLYKEHEQHVPAEDFDTPFRPFSEGVEVTDQPLDNIDSDGFAIPQVEVFSPHGRHIGSRRSLGASIRWNQAEKQHYDAENTSRSGRLLQRRGQNRYKHAVVVDS